MAPVALVPLDGSEQTENALRHAVALLAGMKTQATVRLLTVVDAGFEDIPAELREAIDLDEDDEVYENVIAANPALDRATDIVKSAGLGLERIVRKGKPYDVILDEAARVEMLIMHRLAKSELKEKLRGSMTERLTRNAPCHVLLVREDLPLGD